jgi:hypothetical protein
MSSVSNDFMQDILIALGATFGFTCLVRACCVCLRRRRALEQQQSPVTPSPFPDVIRFNNNSPPSYPPQFIQQYLMPSAPPSTPQYVVYPGVQYPTYPMTQVQQQMPYYIPPPVAQAQHV